MGFLGSFQPRVVRFRIALSLVGVVFILAGWFLARRPRHEKEGVEQWQSYGRLSLVLGWLGVLAAVMTGLIDQSRAPDVPAVRQVINQHITADIALVVVPGLAIYWPVRSKGLLSNPHRSWPYVGLLVLVVVLVVLEGWVGGKWYMGSAACTRQSFMRPVALPRTKRVIASGACRAAACARQ